MAQLTLPTPEIKLDPQQLFDFLSQTAIPNRFPVLIESSPGDGKTSIVDAATDFCGAIFYPIYPSIGDPTDQKGMPHADAARRVAEFLPFGETIDILEATEPTVVLLDDLGNATPATMASWLHPILARTINGKPVPECVTFLAATNRRQDKSGVHGIISSIRSRFHTIVGLRQTVDAWVPWAIANGMPVSVISFIRFRPAYLNAFDPGRAGDITNSPSGRTIANLGDLVNAGVPDTCKLSVYAGAVGIGMAEEFVAYEEVWERLPSIDEVFVNPSGFTIPSETDVQHALVQVASAAVTTKSAGVYWTAMDRLPRELQAVAYKDSSTRDPGLLKTKAYMAWISANSELVY